MKREVYQMGAAGKKYGIWNTMKKCWQFGIVEDTPMLAEARLFQKIGDDANKWRFDVRELPPDKIVKAKRPCAICSQKPMICDRGVMQTYTQVNLAKDNGIPLYAGVDTAGRVFVFAGVDRAVSWYPNFCPECGRKLYGRREDNG